MKKDLLILIGGLKLIIAWVFLSWVAVAAFGGSAWLIVYVAMRLLQY